MTQSTATTEKPQCLPQLSRKWTWGLGPFRWEGKIHTAKNSGVDASTEPPNQTANLWMGWLTTLTSTGCDWRFRREGAPKKEKKHSAFSYHE